MAGGPLRIGIAGANAARGWARDAHVPALRALPGFALQAVSARTRAIADAAAEAFGAARAYDDSLALARDPDIDVVAVTVKVPEHRAIILAALTAGKHVYCEWPLARDLAEAEELAEAARRAGAHVAIGLQGANSLAVRHAARLVRGGAIGRPLNLRVVSATAGWGAVAPPHYRYLQDRRNGATLATIAGGHTLAMATTVIGTFVEVGACNSILRDKLTIAGTGEIVDRTCADHMLIQGRHPSGCVSGIEIVGGEDLPLRFELRGTAGSLTITGHHPGGYQCAALTVTGPPGSEPQPAPDVTGLEGAAVNVAELWRRFGEDIRTGSRTVADFAMAVRLHRLLDAVDLASDEGHNVTPHDGEIGSRGGLSTTMEWTMRTDPSGFRTRWNETLARGHLVAGHWTPGTLTDTARAAVEADPDRVLLIEGERRVTRAEAWDQALRLAGFFLARGLKPGDVVSFQLPNWTETATIALAARMCGLVVNPIPPIYREAELGYILADCGAKLIFVPGAFRKHAHEATIAALRPSLPALRDVVIVRDEGELCWEDAVAGEPVDERRLPQVDPAAVLIAMYTSGTTGRPKGVLHTHYTYGHRVRAMGGVWSIGPDDVVFMPSPVTHITGAIWAIDMPWMFGNSAVLIDVWAADDGIDCIARNRCTVTGGATPFLQQMLDVARHRPESLASLRIFFCGGTTVSPDLIRAASAAFPDCLFFRCYGSTEMISATLGIHDRAHAQLGAETDGEIVAPVALRIVDAVTDAPLPDGEEGEILAGGPGLFAGYLHPSDNDGAFLDDGFFRMGDLGRIVPGDDGADYVVITGRKKDIIIRSGENISPKEVEDVLFNHPAVAEVAIVAMPSPTTGEKGCAFVIPRPGMTIDLPEIRRFLDGSGLARQKFPEHVVLVDDLPRVPSGKVRKDVLRQRAEEIAAAAG